MFSLICVWINGWVNNREAGDLRRYHGHYDVIVMLLQTPGPGSHNATDCALYKSRAPSFTLKPRLAMVGDSTTKPGPGAHCPERVSSIMTLRLGKAFLIDGPVWEESPMDSLHKRSLMRSFDIFFDVCVNKLLNKQSNCGLRHIDTLWRHYDDVFSTFRQRHNGQLFVNESCFLIWNWLCLIKISLKIISKRSNW